MLRNSLLGGAACSWRTRRLLCEKPVLPCTSPSVSSCFLSFAVTPTCPFPPSFFVWVGWCCLPGKFILMTILVSLRVCIGCVASVFQLYPRNVQSVGQNFWVWQPGWCSLPAVGLSRAHLSMLRASCLPCAASRGVSTRVCPPGRDTCVQNLKRRRAWGHV